MKVEKTSRFLPKFTRGRIATYGEAEFPVTLDLSVADADVGTIGAGKPMALKTDDHDEMIYATGQSFLGFLNQPVSNLGVGSDSAFINNMRNDVSLGRNQIPMTRGRQIGITCFDPLSIIEFEGVGAAGFDTFVATSGTGLLASTDAAGVELALLNGSWVKAATTNWVFAFMMISDLTPLNAGELRIRIQLVSPYQKA